LFRRGVNDTEFVEECLGISTFAIIPYSLKQKQLNREMKRKIQPNRSYILAKNQPKDIAIEGIRSLRTMLQFTLAQANNNIVGILGASPNIGKSFVSTNLAQVLVDSGKHVLLIDCDMRKGKVNQYLGQNKSPGFSELLANTKGIEEVVRNVAIRFDFIAAGEYPKNPSEILMSEKLNFLLTKFSKFYDIVIIDTPPVLAVTDAIIIAKHAATNLMVIGSDSDQLEELKLMVKRVKRSGIEIDGLVFNNKIKTEKAYGQCNYYYAYENQEG
jgi:tyrosine-protein kinase Etk/Wzc